MKRNLRTLILEFAIIKLLGVQLRIAIKDCKGNYGSNDDTLTDTRLNGDFLIKNTQQCSLLPSSCVGIFFASHI